MARLFDAYIIVDWSAASKPVRGPNSIWVAVCTKDRRQHVRVRTYNPATRLDARQLILEQTQSLIARGNRVLLGFDFAMGYPAGTADALNLEGPHPPWKRMQDHLVAQTIERADNSNARFQIAAEMNAAMTGGPHPFWGATKTKACKTLSMKKGDFKSDPAFPEHRICERWIRANFKANPKSVWQLTGIGSVGSQALLGLPTLAYIRECIEGAQIWPFETGFKTLTPNDLKNTSCVLAEIYPSTVELTPKTGETLDETQVKTLSKHMESLDSAGNLASAFGPPDSISGGEIHKITTEEGWILAK
ncbi:MAG: hypothetical protein AAGL11_07150 [Pseudomonadota bacterium]